MTMTRESDYAVRIMRALSHGSLKTVKEICGEEAIPTQFAYKILKKLSNAGLIQIIRVFSQRADARIPAWRL